MTTLSTPSQYIPAVTPEAESDYDEGEEEYEEYPDHNNNYNNQPNK